jgi:hypothetical protein
VEVEVDGPEHGGEEAARGSPIISQEQWRSLVEVIPLKETVRPELESIIQKARSEREEALSRPRPSKTSRFYKEIKKHSAELRGKIGAA